jgi:glucokinase
VLPVTSIITLDVGGTSIKTGIVAGRLATLGPSLPTRSGDAADVVLTQLTAAVEAADALSTEDAAGVAIAFPGPFDVAGGRALIRGLHKFESIYGLDLRAELRRRLVATGSPAAGLPIGFARDSESAGMGEAVFGAGHDGGRVLTVTIGTGLGACLTAAVRHVEIVEVVGDLEIEKLAQRPTTGGRADDMLSARGLADRLGVNTAELAAMVDEPEMRDAVADHGRRLGDFLAPVVAELDVDLVVVGGGLVAVFDLFSEPLRAALGDTRCEPATLGASGPLLGAALLAFPQHSFS